jgi:hypothetical protein
MNKKLIINAFFGVIKYELQVQILNLISTSYPHQLSIKKGISCLTPFIINILKNYLTFTVIVLLSFSPYDIWAPLANCNVNVCFPLDNVLIVSCVCPLP